jgi:hypothetical protein
VCGGRGGCVSCAGGGGGCLAEGGSKGFFPVVHDRGEGILMIEGEDHIKTREGVGGCLVGGGVQPAEKAA